MSQGNSKLDAHHLLVFLASTLGLPFFEPDYVMLQNCNSACESRSSDCDQRSDRVHCASATVFSSITIHIVVHGPSCHLQSTTEPPTKLLCSSTAISSCVPLIRHYFRPISFGCLRSWLFGSETAPICSSCHHGMYFSVLLSKQKSQRIQRKISIFDFAEQY
jgi:hypothetical protein